MNDIPIWNKLILEVSDHPLADPPWWELVDIGCAEPSNLTEETVDLSSLTTFIDARPSAVEKVRERFKGLGRQGTPDFKCMTFRPQDVSMFADQTILGVDIDIDGQDMWVAQRFMEDIRPLLIMVEINPHIPPPIRWGVCYDPDFQYKGGAFHSCSIQQMSDIAVSHGYSCFDLSGNNLYMAHPELGYGHVDARRLWWEKCWPVLSNELASPYARWAGLPEHVVVEQINQVFENGDDFIY